MEGEKFPTATFTGKIIAPIRFDMHGKAAIRAKGMLRMHGIDQERIIAGTLTRQGSTLRVQASFSVLLDEFGISVPKIVHQKVAKTIYVHVDIQLQRSA